MTGWLANNKLKALKGSGRGGIFMEGQTCKNLQTL